MALLFTSPLASLSSPSSANSGLVAHPFIRLCHKSVTFNPKSNFGGRIEAPFVLKNRGALIAKASLDVDSADSTPTESPTTPPSESIKEASVSVENLPLESKAQLLLEAKTRMKLAKKIRLRRKRLVRKRHLRKKGRWPPSKMKKNKNV